jgi:hypothetical protein
LNWLSIGASDGAFVTVEFWDQVSKCQLLMEYIQNFLEVMFLLQGVNKLSVLQVMMKIGEPESF